MSRQRLSRRRAVSAALALVATAFARARAVQAGGTYAGPLADVHCHLSHDRSPDAASIVSLLEQSGVTRAFLFGEPWPLATAAWERFPSRVVPFLAEGYSNAIHPDSSHVQLAGLEHLLSGGFVRGLGEIICRHSPFQLGAVGGYAAQPANHVPADHPALIEAYRLAGRFGAIVNIHQEWFYSDELERALAAAPNTTFVWAHAGHGGATVVRRLVERHPNLLADLSARTPWIGPGTVLLLPDGRLDPAWAALLEQHADRFLIGLDLFAPAHFLPAYVDQLTRYYRDLLGQLEPSVAIQVAHLNADRICPP